jgi:hypothetical protein
VLYPLVCEWYRRAARWIVNGSLEDTWKDFQRAWHNVKRPITRDKLREASEMSRTEIVPGSVISVVAHCQSPSLRRLIALCSVLQRMSEIDSFALDGRAVADVLHISMKTVYRNISTLIENGIIERTGEADHRNRKAAHYIYLPAFERCGEIVPASMQPDAYNPAVLEPQSTAA